MPPILAFVVGALGTEVMQLGAWLAVSKDRSLRFYLSDMRGHFVTLLGAGAIFCVAWKNDGITEIVKVLPEWIKGDWIASGFAYTPQVGIIAGGLLAFRGIDKIVAAFKARRTEVPTTQGGTD